MARDYSACALHSAGYIDCLGTTCRQRRWTVRKHDEMGRYAVESITPYGEPIVLDVFGGDELVEGYSVWRLAGLALNVIRAGAA